MPCFLKQVSFVTCVLLFSLLDGPFRIYNAGIFGDAKFPCTYECLVLSTELIRQFGDRKAADIASVSPAVVDSL